MDFYDTTFRHELSSDYLGYMARMRRNAEDFAKMCLDKAMSSTDAMRPTYLNSRDNALSRIVGMDHAIRCLGYEWDDDAGRYSAVQTGNGQ